MDRYQALKKVCLNNWHYIDEKTLSFHEEINFFTGHSGSGKSTVLDALQIVLYADSNGRGFFNKAAKEDSDRTLIEYLRGMKVVQENNRISYLRNKNFSSTIVLEFQDTETGQYQSIGIAFDVDVTTNEANRMFFRHEGPLLQNGYRKEEKVFSLNELKEYFRQTYSQDAYFISRTNERFRNELYSNYLGGLNPKQFQSLFKKAIPFKMDMRLEEFVKQYICTEHDIHMEDMQDSVAQYIRLKRKLEDTRNEIQMLGEIGEQFKRYEEYCDRAVQYRYCMEKTEIKGLLLRLESIKNKQSQYKRDLQSMEETREALRAGTEELTRQRDEVMLAIQNSGYDSLESELSSINQVLELLYRSKSAYDAIAGGLSVWKEVLPDSRGTEVIDKIQKYDASSQEMKSLSEEIRAVRGELETEKRDISLKLAGVEQDIAEALEQSKELESGQNAYPGWLLRAKAYLQERLEHFYKKPVPIDILADKIEVKHEMWRNAVEGYMGNNKLALVVPPEFSQKAMEFYGELEAERYYKVAILDTDKIQKEAKPVMQYALAEEVTAEEGYVRAYIDFLMGNVIKCSSVEELSGKKCGITPECILYQGYRLQHINPKNYVDHAYIGKKSVEKRMERLQERMNRQRDEKKPLDERLEKINTKLDYEAFTQDADGFYKQMCELKQIQREEVKKEEYLRKIRNLKENSIGQWKEKQKYLEQEIREKNKQKEIVVGKLSSRRQEISAAEASFLFCNEELIRKEREFICDDGREEAYRIFAEQQEGKKPEQIKVELQNERQKAEDSSREEFERLVRKREKYRDQYAYRGFSLTSTDNREYDQLLELLNSDRLREFTEKANEQAKQAVYHFKSDFVYKIRDAIKEVMQQKEDLNRILSELHFGKDKYRFIITRSKGENGKFYDMFMDENLDINPSQLTGELDNQMDLFRMQHEKDYNDLINELLELFLPPEECDTKSMEEARANMERYADYRTYLSFDMEQIVEGMPPMRLSKMLTKNSGGEGQNPLYVALLASFAQVYRLNHKSNARKKSTPGLVVLDEAFSKMDSEKVGSCIGLIRELGFQAIISATNDKIQNYVDNVDKTFVFANPNKNRISIQEFERREFKELAGKKADGM